MTQILIGVATIFSISFSVVCIYASERRYSSPKLLVFLGDAILVTLSLSGFIGLSYLLGEMFLRIFGVK